MLPRKGGESFDIALDGLVVRTARVAMNRPSRSSVPIARRPSATPQSTQTPPAPPVVPLRRSSSVPAGKPGSHNNLHGAAKTPRSTLHAHETMWIADAYPTREVPMLPAGGIQRKGSNKNMSTMMSPVVAVPTGVSSSSFAGIDEQVSGQSSTLGCSPSDPTYLQLKSPTLLPTAAAPAGGGDASWTYQPPPNNQRMFEFPEDGLRFSSQFDSGNLIQMERIAPFRYQLYSAPDCGNSPQQTNNRQWFHFAVCGANKGTTLHLQMIGLMNSKMYSFGWTPVAAVCPFKPQYSRINTKVVVTKLESMPPTPDYPQLGYKPYDAEGGDEGGDEGGGGKKKGPDCVAMNISFEYRFEVDIPLQSAHPIGHPQCPAVFIASNHPYSFQRLQRALHTWQSIAQQNGLFFHREDLCTTLDRRVVDLLTISSTHGQSATQRELPYVENCPMKPEARPLAFPKKEYIVLSARVHPGETPASHMLHGCLDFLLSGDPRAVMLLEKYVFVVIPMLNPDGVVRGHSRADTCGQNLNRCYKDARADRHPTIFAMRNLLFSIQRTGRLALFIDMHAHANKKGAFFFGNGMNGIDQVQNMLYAKLVALNTPHLEFTSCNFSESNMFAVGKNGEGKDTSSRVVIYRETGFIHSYTLETSYVTGVVQNPVAATNLPGEENDVLGGSPSPKYSQATFADVGKALLVSWLDMVGLNPHSRLPNTSYRTARGVAQWLQRQILLEASEQYKRATGCIDDTMLLSNTPPLLSAIGSSDLPAESFTIKSTKILPPTTVTELHDLLAKARSDAAAAPSAANNAAVGAAQRSAASSSSSERRPSIPRR